MLALSDYIIFENRANFGILKKKTYLNCVKVFAHELNRRKIKELKLIL